MFRSGPTSPAGLRQITDQRQSRTAQPERGWRTNRHVPHRAWQASSKASRTAFQVEVGPSRSRDSGAGRTFSPTPKLIAPVVRRSRSWSHSPPFSDVRRRSGRIYTLTLNLHEHHQCNKCGLGKRAGLQSARRRPLPLVDVVSRHRAYAVGARFPDHPTRASHPPLCWSRWLSTVTRS